MTASEKAIQFIKNIELGKKDTTPIRWEDLSLGDKDYLFEQAENRWPEDKKGYDLLQSMYKLVGLDIPPRIRILQLAFLRRNASAEVKRRILDAMRADLEKLRKSGENTKIYNLLYGDYSLLIARYYEISGNKDRIIIALRGSIPYYNKANAQERIIQVENEINDLEARQEQNSKILPIEVLLTNRSQIESNLSKAHAELEEFNTKIGQKKKELDELEINKKNAELEHQKDQAELDKLRAEIEQLQKKYPSARAILEFMLALPQAATAPLWVEVLRLALQQGDFDSLSVQALERLSIPHPQEALPLLAEIAARAPEPFKIERKQAQTGMAKWFMLIAQSRQEMQANNQLKAAQLMIQAWDTFFTLGTKK